MITLTDQKHYLTLQFLSINMKCWYSQGYTLWYSFSFPLLGHKTALKINIWSKYSKDNIYTPVTSSFFLLFL